LIQKKKKGILHDEMMKREPQHTTYVPGCTLNKGHQIDAIQNWKGGTPRTRNG